MPSLKETRNRIASVKNTQKITRAMKLVAAAKLRRAQEAVGRARPYANSMRDVIAVLSQSIDETTHPLFRRAEAPGTAVVVPMTSDRGLCGGFNSNVLRRTSRLLVEHAEGFERLTASPIGRKGVGFARRGGLECEVDLETHRAEAHRATAAATTEELIASFVEGRVDAVYIVFNEFVSALTQNVVVQQLLPLSPSSFETAPEDAPNEFIFEPDEQGLLDELLPRFVESQMLLALLESEASEMGARMTAMDSATNNASDIIDKLTLEMNRARQAIITTELMEITSGAEALKG